MIFRFGDQNDESFVDQLWGFPVSEHLWECLKQGWRDFVHEFLKEFRRDAVASWHFVLRHRQDGLLDFLQGELLSQFLVCFIWDPSRGAGPTDLLGFVSAGGICLWGVKVCVEGANVMGQVLLACDLSVFGWLLLKECSFPSYSVEVKETLWACVTVPEPGGGAELVVSYHLLLQGVRQVALCHREDVPDWFVFRVALQLDLCQADFVLQFSNSSSFCLPLFSR